MSEINVLIVEDEWMTSQFLEDILIELGYSNIHIVQNADDAIKTAKKINIDIVFMDINIDGKIDGIQCAIILNSFYPIPTIFMSAYKDEDTISNASDTNIYGYITKPFRKLDVHIALKILKRRIKKDIADEIGSYIKLKNNYQLNKTTSILELNHKEIKLTKKERELISFLIMNINTYITYEQLKIAIWKDPATSSSAIRDAVLRIRKKAPGFDIENYSGVGYRICTA